MSPLAPRQRDVLAFMLAFCVEHRRAPGRREIADGLGMAPAELYGCMFALAQAGYIYSGPGCRATGEWPCRDLDGTPIRWVLGFVREDCACPPST